jgi:hypothetical protein
VTDIVERLRSLNADFLHEEAADEIERLRGLLGEWKEEPCGGIIKFGTLYLSPERVEAARREGEISGFAAGARSMRTVVEAAVSRAALDEEARIEAIRARGDA